MTLEHDKALTGDLVRSLESATAMMQDLLGDIRANATSLTELKIKLESLTEMVHTLSKVVRDGNGKGSMITRLALVEQSVENLDEYLEEMNNKMGRIEQDIKASLEQDKKTEAEYRSDVLKARLKMFTVAAPGAIALAILLVRVLSGAS